MTGLEILTRMQAATRFIEGHRAKFGWAMRELRIHPDDYLELRNEAEPFMAHESSGTFDSFCGIRLVQDEGANRLPRKA